MEKEKQKIAIFTAGLPASGKSTIIEKMLKMKKYNDFILIDSDKIKETIAGYNPKNPAIVHEKSKILTEILFNNTVKKGKNIIIDSTLTDTKKYIEKINYLKSLNYSIVIIFVVVSLNTSIKRNNSRERIVPEYIIIEKSKIINSAIEKIKSYADKFVRVNNE